MKKLIVISIIIFLLIILLVLVFGKSNTSIINDTLVNNNYILDNNTYRKITTNNTQEDFYNNIKNNKNSIYIEYQYNINTNELKSTNLEYNKLYYLCDITESFSDYDIKYSCESTYKNNQLYLYGKYDYTNNTLSCYNRNDSIDKEIINKYCSIIEKKVNEFIIESNNLLGNNKFKKIVRGDI